MAGKKPSKEELKQLKKELQSILDKGTYSIEYRRYPTDNRTNKWEENGFLQPKFRDVWQELLVCQKCFLVVNAISISVYDHRRSRSKNPSPCEQRQALRNLQNDTSDSANQQPDPEPKPQPPSKSCKSKKISKTPKFTIKNFEKCDFCGVEYDTEEDREHWLRCYYDEVEKYNPGYKAAVNAEAIIKSLKEYRTTILPILDGECGSDLEFSDASDSVEEDETFINLNFSSDSENDADYEPSEESPSSGSDSSGDSGPEELLGATTAKSSVKPIKVDYTEFYRCGSTERFGRKQRQCEECFLYFEEKYYFRMHNLQRIRDGFDAEKGKGKAPEDHPKDLFLPEKLHESSDGRLMCPWKDCTKTCSSKSHIEQHWGSHTSEKRYACWKCGKSFYRSSGARWCAQKDSFPFTQEQVQQMLKKEVTNKKWDKKNYFKSDYKGEEGLRFCNVVTKEESPVNDLFRRIIVGDELSPYVACVECDKTYARNTTSGHDCKQKDSFPFTQEQVQQMLKKEITNKNWDKKNYFKSDYKGEEGLRFCNVVTKEESPVNDLFRRIIVGDELSPYFVCVECDKTYARRTTSGHDCKQDSFPFTQEQVQQMLKKEVTNKNWDKKNYFKSDYKGEEGLRFCNVVTKEESPVNVRFRRIIVGDKLSPYSACVECDKTYARRTTNDHDCKQDSFPFTQDQVQQVINRDIAKSTSVNDDILPPETLSSLFDFKSGTVKTCELDEADPLRKRFLCVLYNDNETGCIKCRWCIAVFLRVPAETQKIDAHDCPHTKKRK